MGEFLIEGPDACSFLNQCLTNNVTGLGIGSGHYTLMCNEQGGTVDDLYLYRLVQQSFMMVVNASRIQADWEWLMHQKDQHIGSPRSPMSQFVRSAWRTGFSGAARQNCAGIGWRKIHPTRLPP